MSFLQVTCLPSLKVSAVNLIEGNQRCFPPITIKSDLMRSCQQGCTFASGQASRHHHSPDVTVAIQFPPSQASRKGWPYYIPGVRAAWKGVAYSRATPCGWPAARSHGLKLTLLGPSLAAGLRRWGLACEGGNRPEVLTALQILSLQLRHLLLDVDAHEAGEVAAEDLFLGLLCQLRVTVAGDEVFGQFKVPEGIQRPAGVPDGGLTAVEDLVLAAPEHELAHVFGKDTRRAHNEVERGGYRGVQVGVAHQLPADFVDEGQADVEDDEVDVGEVSRRAIHVPRLRHLDWLRAERHALMHADGMHSQFKRLFKDGEGHTRIIHAPGEGLTVIIAYIVELKSSGAVLLHLPLHQIERLFAL